MKSNANRSQVGKQAGLVGLFCNLILALGKIVAGSVFSSVSVVADGINNLSDSAASVITLLGFHFSKKPADKQHPYGHARYEYLASLVISALILAAGFELGKSAVGQILEPVRVQMTSLLAAVLLVSLVVKLFLVYYFSFACKRIGSSVLLAAKVDSRNDAVCTLAVFCSVAAETYLDLRLDGITGAALALFILFSGIRLAKKTVSPLLGEDGDPRLKEEITALFQRADGVLDCHDLIIHDYGPDKRYASIHVEMDQSCDPMKSHGILDRLERECLERFGVQLVTHLDPVEKNDPETKALKAKVSALLKMKDPRLEIHDFRIVGEKETGEIYFDVTVPDGTALSSDELESEVENAMETLGERQYRYHITLHL